MRAIPWREGFALMQWSRWITSWVDCQNLYQSLWWVG
jgi:hypothetical protein